MLTKLAILLCLGLTVTRAQFQDEPPTTSGRPDGERPPPNGERPTTADEENAIWEDDTNWANNMDKQDWNNEEFQEWEQDWSENGGDWFGDIVNNPCAPECQVNECEYGELCVETWCTDPCSGDKTCEQSVLLDWDAEWENYDCVNGTVAVEKQCETFCEYNECDESHQFDDVCWVEICDDGCGNYNCSIWYQVEGEWYGEFCPEEETFLPEINMGEVLRNMIRTGRMYQDTIQQVFTTFCPPDDQECLNGGQELVDTLNGKIPQQEPVPAEQTQMVSNYVNGAVSQGAQAADSFIDANIAPSLDAMLSNPNFQQIFQQFTKDTNAAMPMEGEGPIGENLTRLSRADNTEQIVDAAAQQITVENIFGVLEQLVPAESPVNEWFSYFMEGEKNQGMERQGAREDQPQP